MGNYQNFIMIIILIILFLVYRGFVKYSIQKDFSINEINQEIIEINKKTLEMLTEENIETTSKKYKEIKTIGQSICSGNELLYYGSGFNKEIKQYQTICYNKFPLKFKYFNLNQLIGVNVNETKN